MKILKRNRIGRLALPALLLLSACVQSEAPGQETGGLTPVLISSVELTTEVETRATPVLTTGSIGVFNTINAKVYNAHYTYTAGAWKSTAPISVAGYPAHLCAYHPYGAASFAPETTVFDLSAQLYSAAQDLSYAVKSEATKASNTDPNVTFDMVRGYAQLSLKITRKTGYTGGACKISTVALKRPTGNVQAVKTLDISSGTSADKTAVELLSFTNLGALQNVGIASGATDTSFHLLLPPQPLPNGVHLLLTIDRVGYSLAIPSAQLSSWVSGKNYVVEVSVNNTGLWVTQVSTKDWIIKSIDGGTTPGVPVD